MLASPKLSILQFPVQRPLALAIRSRSNLVITREILLESAGRMEIRDQISQFAADELGCTADSCWEHWPEL